MRTCCTLEKAHFKGYLSIHHVRTREGIPQAKNLDFYGLEGKSKTSYEIQQNFFDYFQWFLVDYATDVQMHLSFHSL